jgi:hypothetical protein
LYNRSGTLVSHFEGIFTPVACDPTGRYFLAHQRNNLVAIWLKGQNNGQKPQKIFETSETIASRNIAISPSGDRIAISGCSDEIVVFKINLNSSAELFRLPIETSQSWVVMNNDQIIFADRHQRVIQLNLKRLQSQLAAFQLDWQDQDVR